MVDDAQPLAELWKAELSALADATSVSTLTDARTLMRGRLFDVVLLDLHLPDGSGLELLEELTHRGDDTCVIILTGNGDLNSAIRALRLGALDYLLKPCTIAELETHLSRIARERQLKDENLSLRQQIRTDHPRTRSFVGQSTALQEIRRLIDRVAPTQASVLIQGETGTGKEVAATLIHERSLRSDGPLVPVNCAALPHDLAESELFGHRKGAFTGADRDHRGLVQAAAGGTLFLDEIGDLPLGTQGKFLRLLESSEGRRVGDTESYRTNVRIIAATNVDLRKSVAAGTFRGDLFYRLATFDLRLPSLRQIVDDIPSIAQHLLEQEDVHGATARRFSEAALSMLVAYPWPGNVRELRNVIERAKILCEEEEVGPEHLRLVAPTEPFPPMHPAVPAAGRRATPPLTLEQMEKKMIREALAAYSGNKTAAAKALGISLRTLYNKLVPQETYGAAREGPSGSDPNAD